jgi:cytochrome c oxidase cbb3-type subunit 3
MSESPQHHPAPSAGNEQDRLLDHEYDGILEYDNPMPRWWVWTFWATFWFACAYIFHFWFGNGVSIADSFKEEDEAARAALAAAAMSQPVTEESLLPLLSAAGTVKSGGEVFLTRCAPCHGQKGEGLIGPNLTDGSWIHGGQLLDIYKTVSTGVAAKGMPAWEKQLTPEQLRQVVAFVGTLRGSNIPGKAPEGSPAP